MPQEQQTAQPEMQAVVQPDSNDRLVKVKRLWALGVTGEQVANEEAWQALRRSLNTSWWASGARLLTSMWLQATLYLVTIAAVEVLVARGATTLGITCDAFLILIMLNHYIWLGPVPQRRLLPVLALLPLERLLSITMPFHGASELYWYLMTGIPLLIAITITARMLAFTRTSLGLRMRYWPAQGAIALAGIPLSVIGYDVARPHALIATFDIPHLVVAAVILIISVALAEELLFRSLLPLATSSLFGEMSLAWNAAAFSVLYIGSLSPAYIGMMAAVGLFFGWCVQRTGSLWGVVVAHSVLIVGMTCIWPFVWH